MLTDLPTHYDAVKNWNWAELEPYYTELQNRELNAETIDDWLQDLSAIDDIVGEIMSRVRVKTTQDTADEEAESRYKDLLANTIPHLQRIGNELDKKLLATGLTPAGMEIPLKKMRVDVELFREENIELFTREQVLGMEYAKITGAQTVKWEGDDLPLLQLLPMQQDPDRSIREKAWRLSMERWLQDRASINALWSKLFEVRQQQAHNAGFANYRDFRWKQFKRFDYTPENCAEFHHAIEQVVLPAARKRNEAHRQRLGLDVLRPWDLAADSWGKTPLKPWETINEFSEKAETIFGKVDPVLGEYYAALRHNDLVDLPNRKNKGPGAYCTMYPLTKSPFIFMNAVNVRDDVRTLLHEAGHAFHNFEILNNNLIGMQRSYPIEYAEVASMSMELLAAPYLTHEHGGYFSAEEAARDRIEHLEKILFFWPYMAVVDSFQLWVYTAGDLAKDPAACDDKWAELWSRFMIAADYTGLEDVQMTGWHRKQHIYRYPFYYIEYGLAQLGAVQVWGNALEDQAKAIKTYRHGLSLGGTKSLPELYAATGVKFAFDADTLGKAVSLIERTINELEAQV